jgi:hypothetical protein
LAGERIGHPRIPRPRRYKLNPVKVSRELEYCKYRPKIVGNSELGLTEAGTVLESHTTTLAGISGTAEGNVSLGQTGWLGLTRWRLTSLPVAASVD